MGWILMVTGILMCVWLAYCFFPEKVERKRKESLPVLPQCGAINENGDGCQRPKGHSMYHGWSDGSMDVFWMDDKHEMRAMFVKEEDGE